MVGEVMPIEQKKRSWVGVREDEKGQIIMGKYNPSYCDLLVQHMQEGRSFSTFGTLIDVSVTTLDRWVKNHLEFRSAKLLGEKLRLSIFEDDAILHSKDNAGMTKFMLKNIAPDEYKDKVETDLGGGNITIDLGLGGAGNISTNPYEDQIVEAEVIKRDKVNEYDALVSGAGDLLEELSEPDYFEELEL